MDYMDKVLVTIYLNPDRLAKNDFIHCRTIDLSAVYLQGFVDNIKTLYGDDCIITFQI